MRDACASLLIKLIGFFHAVQAVLGGWICSQKEPVDCRIHLPLKDHTWNASYVALQHYG